MKKLIFSLAIVMLCGNAFAGGLLTNYNQSAQYVRMLSRNASLGIDGVFYNPAGLTKLQDGWHFSLNSQTITQEKTINSGFPLLNDGSYIATTKVPVFPSGYGVYKKNKWAFSLGFGPTSGGGEAEYKRGLPAFEIPISQAVPLLSGIGVIGYNADLYFKGSSVFWGIQLGATYAISEKFSIYGGARVLPAKNVYKGHIKDIQLEMAGSGYQPAPLVLNTAAATMTVFANMPQALAPYLETGGSYTLSQLELGGHITPAQKGGIEAGLQLAGLPQEQIDMMNLNQINGVYVAASPGFQQQAGQLVATATQMEDRIVDTEQTGTSIIPVLGFNYSPNDDWNFAFKWEMKTFLTLDNKPNPDNNYNLWGSVVNADVPGIIAAGIGYRGVDWMEAQFSFNMYNDKKVGWGANVNDLAVWGEKDQTKVRMREIENNYIEIGLGFQFDLTDNFAVSIGGLRSKSGVADSWQHDMAFSNSSYSLGGGIMWNITDRFTVDLGILNTFYEDDVVPFEYTGEPDFDGQPIPSYTNTYGKTTLDFAVGLSYSIF